MTRIPPLIILAVLGAIAAFSISRIQFSASLFEMLPRDLPEVRGMDWLNRYFSRDGQLVVTVRSGDPFLTDEASSSLAERLRSERDRVAAVHEEITLDRLAIEGGGLLAWLWLNAEPAEFTALENRLGAPTSRETIDASFVAVQQGLFDPGTLVRSYDPLGFTRLPGELGAMSIGESDPMASANGSFRLFYVEGTGVDFSDYRDAGRWLEEIRTIVADWENTRNDDGEEVVIGLTGTPAFMAEVGREMERDMTLSIVITMVLISILFWIMHRRHKPLPWLVAAMLLVLVLTLNVGGWLFGNISVMSAGFAAILLGLAVDYGIVIYREAMDTRENARELRRAVGPGIAWAAATTAAVFLSLNLSSLPGIAEMGNLVAIGIAIGAVTMLWGFAPIALELRAELPEPRRRAHSPSPLPRRIAVILAAGVPLCAIASTLVRSPPHLEANFHPFRIRESPSLVAWKELQHELRERENAVPLVVEAPSPEILLAEMEGLESRLETASANGLVDGASLPTPLVPRPDHQAANLPALTRLLGERDRLLTELDGAGFSSEGARLADTIFDSWETYRARIVGENGEPARFVLPSGPLGEWTIARLFAEKEGSFAALGSVRPSDPRDRTWVETICTERVAAASLGSLGAALNERIRSDLTRVFLPLIGILVGMLALVFRNWRDLALSLGALTFAAAVMLLLTIWTPLRWNSFNIFGLPLLFGTGLDFSIHMIFALRRHGGDIRRAERGIGRALLFCGTSSAIGFGSLATASAHGLASLGVVCATGLLVNMAVAVWFLPLWYQWIHEGRWFGRSPAR